MFVREGVAFGSQELTIETGRMAKQADGSVVIRYGDSMVLVTAVAATSIRPGMDFLPLTCEYLEKTSAAGKIPGGYFKREGRLTEAETLTARLIDRPSRPLFPKGWRFDSQVIATVLSTDRENPTDVLAMTGASTALHLSDIPWAGPFAGVRVGRVDGQFVVNPTFTQREGSELDLVVAASRDAIVMVEGGAAEVSEDVLIDALMFAHKAAQPLIDLQEKLRAAVGKPKREFIPPAKDPAIVERVGAAANARIEAAMAIRDKQQRYAALDAAGSETIAGAEDRVPRPRSRAEGSLRVGQEEAPARAGAEHRQAHRRPGPRPRSGQITCEVGVLPRTHGSALFTRGETQALVTATLGTKQDAQHIEGLTHEIEKRFMLHYNFPPYSTGETKPLRGASRREVGHGHLAERALARVLPPEKDFPYTLRIVSEILESNGSSSMASVCGGSLALMDAGVPIATPVGGIAMGLIKEGDRRGGAQRHPRRRGPPGRHGLQGLRDPQGHHRRPDGHQDPGADPPDPGAGAEPGPRRPDSHPGQDERGAGRAPRGAEQVRARASSPCTSSPTRSGRSSARAARPSAGSPPRPAWPSTSRTTGRCTSPRPTGSWPRRPSTSSRASPPSPRWASSTWAWSGASPSSAPSWRSCPAPTAWCTSASSTPHGSAP